MKAVLRFRRKEERDSGINREKWAGSRDLRTLLWTLKLLSSELKVCAFTVLSCTQYHRDWRPIIQR